ncbi:hypothetical protein P9112_008972 [Eukaryota sp. TZLM1-RC]
MEHLHNELSHILDIFKQTLPEEELVAAPDPPSSPTSQHEFLKSLSKAQRGDISSSDDDIDGDFSMKELRKNKGKSGLKGEAADLFGKANMLYMAGNYNEAIAKLAACSNLDKKRPEPFKSLALVYVALKDYRKALGAFFIAAVRGREWERWMELADTAREFGYPRIEEYALGRALISQGTSVDLLIRRARVLVGLNERKSLLKAADELTKAVNLNPSNLDVIQELIELLTGKIADYERAEAVLESVFETRRKSAKVLNNELLNYYCDLLIHKGHWQKVSEVLTEVGTILSKSSSVNQSPGFSDLITCLVPDLAAKLICAHIHMGDNITESCLPVVVNWEVEQFFDLYDVIGSAAINSRNAVFSIISYTLFLALVQQFSDNPYYHCQLGKAQRDCDLLPQAIQSFIQSLELFDNPETRIELSKTLKQIGNIDAALDALKSSGQDTEHSTQFSDVIKDLSTDQIKLHLEHANMLFEERRFEEFVQLSVPFICTMFINTKKLRPGRPFPTVSMPGIANLLGVFSMMKFISSVIEALSELSRYDDSLLVVHSLMVYGGQYVSSSVENQLRKVLVSLVLRSNTPYFAYGALRDCLTRTPRSIPLHMLLTYVMASNNLGSTDIGQTHQKFLSRHSRKGFPFLVCLGLHYLSSGRYASAFDQLVNAFQLKKVPFLYVPLACCCLGIARNKATRDSNKMMYISSGYWMLKQYAKIQRDVSDRKYKEGMYNIGRYLHSIGLFALAISYYKKVLKHFNCFEHVSGVEYECAFNLFRIYADQGLDLKAREVLDTYLVI